MAEILENEETENALNEIDDNADLSDNEIETEDNSEVREEDSIS